MAKTQDTSKLASVFKAAVNTARVPGKISAEASTTAQAQKLARTEDAPVVEEE
jgi:hypothetical protein